MESVSMNNENREGYLIELANVKMTDSVIGVIGKITSLSAEEYMIVKEWYEQLAGHEFNIVRDAIDVRKNAIGYLKSKNIKRTFMRKNSINNTVKSVKSLFR